MNTSGRASQRSHINWLTALSAAVATTAAMAPMASHAAGNLTVTAAPPCPAVWSATTIYTVGNEASQGKLSYKAKWWTQNEDPATHNGEGQVWDKPTECTPGTNPPPPPPPGDCPAWSATVQYDKKDGVTGSNNKLYKAMKPSIGKDPVTNNGPKGSGEPWKKVKDCPDGGTNPPPPPPPTGTVADPNAPAYTGYYPSWSDNWFDATGKTPDQVYQESNFAKIPANYNYVVAAFAFPNFSWGGMAANSWSGTGLNFNARPSDIKASIDVLHSRKIKVLLAVGGATYNDWDGLAAEGAAGSGSKISALTQIMKDLGFDGLDIDYEADANVDRYANASKAMRIAVDNAGGGRILAMPGWSTGADCVAATSGDSACAGRLSFWGGNAGRERLLVKKFANFDLVNIMSYDARYENYDGVTAWNDYRSLFPSKVIVSIGLETSPEGWSGANLVVNDADAQCEGSKNLKNQYGVTLNLPYSVDRYTKGVRNSSHPNRNPRDGAMLWSILKTASGSCGGAPLATPGTIGKKVVQNNGGVDDPMLQNSPFR